MTSRGALAVALVFATTAFAQPTKQGRALFASHCSMCHGEDADGQGPLASRLPLKPRNFRSEPLHWGNSLRSVVLTVTNGRSGVMPSFSDVLTPAQIDQVANYVWGVMPPKSKNDTTEPPTATVTPTSRVFLVHQKNKTFVPKKIDARLGDTLIFVNDDTVEHEVHSLTNPESPPIQSQKPTQWDRVVLETEGVVKFGCAIHPSMRLEVNVAAVVDEVTVTQKGKVFSPGEITVKPGARITFVNDDTVVHNVVSREAHFDLQAQQPGGKSVAQFNDLGTYEVRCAIHPGMKLKVRVRK